MLFELEQISEPALINLKTQQENNATMLLYYFSSQTSTPDPQIENVSLCFQALHTFTHDSV